MQCTLRNWLFLPLHFGDRNDPLLVWPPFLLPEPPGTEGRLCYAPAVAVWPCNAPIMATHGAIMVVTPFFDRKRSLLGGLTIFKVLLRIHPVGQMGSDFYFRLQILHPRHMAILKIFTEN